MTARLKTVRQTISLRGRSFSEADGQSQGSLKHNSWRSELWCNMVNYGKLSGSDIAVLVVLVRAAWLLELGSKFASKCQVTCRWYCRIEHGGTINVGPCPLCFLLLIFSRSARNQRSSGFWDLHNEIQIAAKREATPVHGHFKKGRLWFSISHRMFYCAYSCLFYLLLVYYYMLVSNEFPQPSSRTSWTRQQQ